jgi:hypothetical protein
VVFSPTASRAFTGDDLDRRIAALAGQMALALIAKVATLEGCRSADSRSCRMLYGLNR